MTWLCLPNLHLCHWLPVPRSRQEPGGKNPGESPVPLGCHFVKDAFPAPALSRIGCFLILQRGWPPSVPSERGGQAGGGGRAERSRRVQIPSQQLALGHGHVIFLPGIRGTRWKAAKPQALTGIPPKRTCCQEQEFWRESPRVGAEGGSGDVGGPYGGFGKFTKRGSQTWMPATKKEPTASQHWPRGLYHPRCVTGLSLLSVDPCSTQRGS